MAIIGSSVWPVNEKGEVVATTGTGTTNVVAYLSQDNIATDTTTNKFSIVGVGGSQATISGVYKVGQTLTAIPAPGWSFTAGQWKRAGATISGATSLTYVQVTADIGQVLSFTPTNPVYAVTGGTTTADVPGAPTIGTATAGNGTVTVAFTAPASDGGAPITGYKVTLNNGDIATGTSSPITVTGQANGIPKTAVVQALNSIGYGPASATSNSVTPAVAPAELFRTATPYNRVATSFANTGAGLTRRLATVKNCTIGSGARKNLKVKIDNVVFNSGGAAISGIGNAFNVVLCQILWDANGTWKDVLFNGVACSDATPLTINDFQYDVLSDTILPSQFTRTNFPVGTPIYVRTVIEATNGKLPQLEGTDTVLEGIIYDPAASVLVNNGRFPPTVTGAAGTQSAGFSAALIGEFEAAETYTWMLDGDSLFAQGTSWSYGVRAMKDSPPIAAWQVGRVGGQQFIVTSFPDLYRDCYLKYCSGVINEYGTNSITGVLINDASNTQTYSLNAWAFFRANYKQHPNALPFKIYRVSLLQKTTGTFGSDPATQTVTAGWGAAGSAEVFNDWLATQVGVGNGPDYFYDPNTGANGTTRAGATRADPNYYKWANGTTFDGIHNNLGGCNILGPNMRADLVARGLA